MILVRNPVHQDARVLREAATLTGLGFTVLICGVVSTDERRQELELGGVQVLRLDPAAPLRRWVDAARVRAARPTGGARDGAAGGEGGAESQNGAESDDRAASGDGVGSADGVGSRDLAGAALAGNQWRRRCRRLALTVSFHLHGIALVRRMSPALVHANDYNTMWIGVAAKLLCGSRLVYDTHELWADRNGRPEWRPWLIGCEALFVRLADVTITASPGYASAIARRYHVPPPVVVRNIPARDRPQDADPRSVGAQAARRPAGPSTTAPSAPVAVYLGGLMPGRGLEQAIEALALVPELQLKLIGPGRKTYREGLRRLSARVGVSDRVEMSPAVPPSDVVAAIDGATMGLMLIQPICRSYELTLPNKLFEYAAAGLPILTSDLPVIGPLVRDEGLGEVVPADDIALIARGMRRLSEPTLRVRVCARVNAFAERVTWEHERAILEDVYGSPDQL